MNPDYPNVGDVIRSAKFAYGHRGLRGEQTITIDGNPDPHMMGYSLTDAEFAAEAIRLGAEPERIQWIDLSVNDPSRGEAEFVVEKAGLQGGGTGMGPHDIYPDGWYVEARRLRHDGSYDPNGEVIHFYMSGSFNCMVLPSELTVVRQMQRWFI